VRDRKKRLTSFPLRLATSLKNRSTLLANRDGVSLNQFVNIAVAEKISRLEGVLLRDESPSIEPAFLEIPSENAREPAPSA
jgi:HicB family